MSLSKENKKNLIEKNRRHQKDTGSTEVQVALLTEKINMLTEHFKVHKKDFHSQRGLMRMVNQRKRLLKYLQKTDNKRYLDLIKRLNIRK